jgi:hypothetical protein
MEPDASFQELHDEAVAAQNAADFPALRRISAQMTELGEATGDRSAIAWGDYFLGIALIFNNEASAADRVLRRALGYFRDSGDRLVAARTMLNLAMIEVDINVNAAAARRLYEEAAPVIRDSGDTSRLAILLGNLAEIDRLEGDYDAALRNARESARLFRGLGDRGRTVWQLVNIAHFQSLRRANADALATLREAYEELILDPNPRWVALYFELWVILAAKLEHWETAALLLGYVDRLRSDFNVPRLQGMLPWLSSPMERLAATLKQERLHELFADGESLTIGSAQALTRQITS